MQYTYEIWMWHWHLWSSDKEISYEVRDESADINLAELKPGEWKVYKIEVTVG